MGVIVQFGNVLTFLLFFFTLKTAPGPGFRSGNLRGKFGGCNCAVWERSNVSFWFFFFKNGTRTKWKLER